MPFIDQPPGSPWGHQAARSTRAAQSQCTGRTDPALKQWIRKHVPSDFAVKTSVYQLFLHPMPWLRSSAARRPLFAGYGVTSLAPGGTSFQVLSPRGPGALRRLDALMLR